MGAHNPTPSRVIGEGADPEGASCNLPTRSYNSMNSDFGGDLIKARFGPYPPPTGSHVLGVLLADDHHNPVLEN